MRAPINPERSKQIDDLLRSALSIAPDEREKFLRRSCGADSELFEAVCSRLLVREKGATILASPADSPADVVTQTSNDGAGKIRYRSMVGETVSHYRVLARLGSGGMGVVYEAEDIKLGRRVAMKFLPGDVGGDWIAFERMQLEARAASALDHQNICSIYELGERDGQPFIVMQLLKGQPLSEWIKQASTLDKRTRMNKALELGIQIARGLEAAHKKSIVHRDIKPANIFITDGGVIKILDFGLAKVIQDRAASLNSTQSTVAGTTAEHADLELTRAGAAIGTKYYMSPEQIRGDKLDERTDLFSFGLVLYEMTTGQRAFPADTGTAVYAAILSGKKIPVRRLNPAIPVSVERIIDHALERDRIARYQSAGEIRADLERIEAGRSGKYPAVLRFGAPVVLGSLLLLLVFLAFNVGGVRDRILRHSTAPATAAPIKQRPSIAVLGFKNLSGRTEQEWVSTALLEMLAAQLSAGEQLRVVSSEDVARMKIDLALSNTDSYGRDTLRRIRDHLGADMVVLGSYLDTGDAGGRIHVDLHLQDARNGETIGVVSNDGSEAGLPELATLGGASLRQKLNIANVSVGESSQIAASQSGNSDATRFYAEGLQKLQAYDAMAARDLFEQAIKADPNYALAHAALAEAWAALGYSTKAEQEAKKAFDLSDNLSRAQHLSIEARYREMTRNFAAAIQICQTLYNFFPDQIEYGLKLANVQMQGDQPKDALATIEKIRQSGVTGSDGARVDLAEANVQQTLSDFKRGQEASARAAEKGKLQGAIMIVAAARIDEGWAWDHLGQLDKAMAALSEARDIAESRNPNVAARAHLLIGHVLYDKGDFDGARKSYESSLASYKKVGDQNGVAHALQALGNILYEQGRLDEAEPLYREQLRLYRELEAKAGMASALGSLGNLLEAKGDFDGAARDDEESASAFHELGNKRSEATSFGNLGLVLIEEGHLPAAKSSTEKAMALQQEIGYKRGIGFSLYALALIDLLEDNLVEARKLSEQALALRKEIGDETNVARSQVQLAEIAIEQNKAAEAEALASQAIDAFSRQKDEEDGVASNAVYSRGLLELSKFDAAKTAAEASMAHAQHATDHDSRLQASLAAAEVDARTGKAPAAIKIMQSLISDAEKVGNVPFTLEARLRLGMAELQTDPLSARKHLQQLQEDARKKDFRLIARKAGSAHAR